MKTFLFLVTLILLFACKKNNNLLDDPAFVSLENHSWKLDSSHLSVNGVTTVTYATQDSYQTANFIFPHCVFYTQTNMNISDSAKYSFDYEPNKIVFFPVNGGESDNNYAIIKAVNDTQLILERHTSADNLVPVVTNYYHAQ